MLLSEEDPELIRPARRCNVRSMSFNRAEQALFDYIENHAEERQFWQGKVRDLMSESRDDLANSAVLTGELGRYFDERSRVGVVSAQVVENEGFGRVSLRNLAEHMMRIWGPVRPPRPAGHSARDEISL